MGNVSKSEEEKQRAERRRNATHVSAVRNVGGLVSVVEVTNHVLGGDVLISLASILLESSHLLEEISCASVGGERV